MDNKFIQYLKASNFFEDQTDPIEAKQVEQMTDAQFKDRINELIARADKLLAKK